MGLSPEARQYFYQSMLPAIEGKVSQNVHKKSYDDIVLEVYERENRNLARHFITRNYITLSCGEAVQ